MENSVCGIYSSDAPLTFSENAENKNPIAKIKNSIAFARKTTPGDGSVTGTKDTNENCEHRTACFPSMPRKRFDSPMDTTSYMHTTPPAKRARSDNHLDQKRDPDVQLGEKIPRFGFSSSNPFWKISPSAFRLHRARVNPLNSESLYDFAAEELRSSRGSLPRTSVARGNLETNSDVRLRMEYFSPSRMLGKHNCGRDTRPDINKYLRDELLCIERNSNRKDRWR